MVVIHYLCEDMTFITDFYLYVISLFEPCKLDIVLQ